MKLQNRDFDAGKRRGKSESILLTKGTTLETGAYTDNYAEIREAENEKDGNKKSKDAEHEKDAAIVLY